VLDDVAFSNIHTVKVRYILDREHIQIKRKHERARSAIIEGGGMNRIIACSKELIATTLAHFKSEESAMDACNPRNITTHKRLHADLIESLKDISNDLEQRRIIGAMALMKLFDERLTNHLEVEDADLERELRS